jgi:putative membrane protein
MVKDHDMDIAEFEREARTNSDPDVKAWAAKTLPTLKEHQRLIHTLYRDVDTPAGTAGKS